MQYDINKHLEDRRLREQTEAEQVKKEKATDKRRMNRELQCLRKEDRRSRLVEEETVRRAEKEAQKHARAEAKKKNKAAKKKAEKRATRNKKRRERRAATKEARGFLTNLHFKTNCTLLVFLSELFCQGLRGEEAKARQAAANERAKERKKAKRATKRARLRNFSSSDSNPIPDHSP